MDVEQVESLEGVVPPAQGRSPDGARKRGERVRPLRRSTISLRFSERRLLLAVLDLVAINLALFLRLAYEGRMAFEWGAVWAGFPWFLLLTALWMVVALLLDVYDLPLASNALRSCWTAGGATLLASVIYLLIPQLTPGLPARRIILLMFPVLATGGVIAWRGFYAKVLGRSTFYHSVLVVGAGWAGHTLARALAGQAGAPIMGYRILGFIDDDPAKLWQWCEGVRVIGTSRDLVRLAGLLGPDEVILAITAAESIHPELFQAILDCSEMGIPLTTMADLFERATGRVPVEHAGRNLQVVLPMNRPAAYRVYVWAWRAFEIAVALAGCACTLALVPLVWLVNRLTCPGDLFYRQERVGKGGRTFSIVKFRSMVMDAEKGCGAVWSRQGDDRITPLGRLLRKTRLDEFPQFWNVLKGEMSLIGPRPERPVFVEQLAEQIPFYRVRHAVKPGITGWAQVMYRYGASADDALIKLQYDLYYFKHQGPYLDLSILIKTLRVMCRMEGC